jgi:hypothetical protein
MNTTILNKVVDDIQPIFESFLECLVNVKKYQFKICTLQMLTKSVKLFHGKLQSASKEGLTVLKDQYYHDLLRVKFFLKSSNESTLISFHDKIFKNILVIDKHFPRGITLLFEEIIKGITYFSYQVDLSNPMPIYHRIYACGVGDDGHRKTHHICNKELPREERKRRKDIIERCYIERKIYDCLYKNEQVHLPETWNAEIEQDNGHKHRLELTKKDFQTCFKDQEIEVAIEYEGNMPYQIRLLRTANERPMYEEVFTKQIDIDSYGRKHYSEVVECTRISGDLTYKKVQTFKSKTTYKRA